MTDTPAAPPALRADAHKGDAGRLLLLCGSAAMPGAALLVARAAQRAGAGLVTVGCLDRELRALVPLAAPEALLLDLTGGVPRQLAERVDDARVVGCGLGDTPRTRRLVETLLADGFAGATVLDADALNVLAGEPELLAAAPGPLVLTPHPLEAARLLGREVPGDDEGRAAAARELARRSGAVVCLKGRHTVVVDGRSTYVNATGNPGMATAGSGDVLAGILGAYLAQRADASTWTPFLAACAAVHAHGLAGDLAAAELGERGVIARDLVESLPAAQLRIADGER